MIYNSEERIGVYSVAKIFIENMGWIFREQPISDFGIDAFVEITKNGADLKDKIPTGKLIGVQIKSGKSFFKEGNGDHFVFRGTKKHLQYWLDHSIPVIIVLYNKETNCAYWQVVNESTVHLTDKSFKINIPKRNLLELNSRQQLTSIGIFKGRYEYNLWQLEAWIDAIRSSINTKMFLYGEIDRISGSDEYHISLVITDEVSDNCIKIIHSYDDNVNRYDCHFYLSKGQSLKEAINDTLPWADLFLGEAEFSDEALTEHMTDEILNLGQEEFVPDVLRFKKENSFLDLACYLTGSYCFALNIKANDLAFNFLEVNKFLSKEPVVKQTIFL